MNRVLTAILLLLALSGLAAQDVYITDQIKAGLHEERSINSPILKLIATGSRLEIIKREDRLSYVRDTDGTSGWINNSYLTDQAPGDASELTRRAEALEQRLTESRERNRELEGQIQASASSDGNQSNKAHAALQSSFAKLEEQHKAEKLRVGELQIELTELRNRLGQDSDVDALYEQVKGLEEENKQLEIQLARTLDKYELDGNEAALIQAESRGGFDPGLRNMLIYLAITLFLGLCAGAYLLDMWNRRRHGGFRI